MAQEMLNTDETTLLQYERPGAIQARLAYAKHKKKMRTRAIKSTALAVCVIAVCAGIFCLGTSYVAASSIAPGSYEVSTVNASTEDLLARDIDWNYWKSINPEIIGWIEVPYTNLDYPIVQPTNNTAIDYYRTHDIYGHVNAAGTPYVDARVTAALYSPDCIIRGRLGALGLAGSFDGILGYSDAVYANTHPTIVIKTPYGDLVYRMGTYGTLDDVEDTITKNIEAQASDYIRAIDLNIENQMTADNTGPITKTLTLVAEPYDLPISNTSSVVIANHVTLTN